MNSETKASRFNPFDFFLFGSRLSRETDLLATWFAERRFLHDQGWGGFELEAWLVDAGGNPAPRNQAFLERLGDYPLVPELSLFNVEFNTEERPLRGDALRRMHDSLATTWTTCDRIAMEMEMGLMMIGILPTVSFEDLTFRNMTPISRYMALNEQVIRMHGDTPFEINISGREHLRLEHHDILVEAATTSFQIHLQVNQEEAVRMYNAALIASAPMVAIAANAPFLFGKSLWDETRIPVFEQSVPLGRDRALSGPLPRVDFGHNYVRDSLLELFLENQQSFPPLLPITANDRPEHMHHVRMHNSTIWRWNRPLVGFDSQGRPHLRLEHRVTSAGPTVMDCMANAALFYGLVHALSELETPPERVIPFFEAQTGFYLAARHGLEASILWLQGNRVSLRELLYRDLLPLARRGLDRAGLDAADRDEFLGIIEGRLRTGQNGAAWQRAFVERHGKDMGALTLAYLERQRAMTPVHGWTL
ncbi:MAG: glutamate--cysteine ligase [Magnetococcales bacterium]|nr:glutamate--cysteine ligase [Magnetococcales bacterium]